jgi:hypothetical protein
MALFARAYRRPFFGCIGIMAIRADKVLMGFGSDFFANLCVCADKS